MKITEIDLSFVKHYLRVDHEEDDQLIQLMLTASKGFIQSYLNQKFEDFEIVPDELTIPALALISHWYEQRQITTDRSAHEVLYTFSGILDMYRMWVGGAEVLS